MFQTVFLLLIAQNPFWLLSKKAKAALHAAQQRQAITANRRRREMNIAVGDSVFLSTANIKLKFKGSPKLLPRWIGPFKVLEQINPVAFRL
jgi:hypothetical protein